jgi:hypothetical protein
MGGYAACFLRQLPISLHPVATAEWLDYFLKVWTLPIRKVCYILRQGLLEMARRGASARLSASGNRRGMAMAAIERDSVESEPFHDFKWHRLHRGRHTVQLGDVVMLLGWAALVGWVLFHQ